MYRFTTEQGLFTAIVTGLAAQGWNGGYDHAKSTCRYRTDDGRGCAIGVLIPEGQYDPRVEERPAFRSFCGQPDESLPCAADLAGIDPDLDSFASNLQRLHDDTLDECEEEGPSLHEAFQTFAKNKGLTWPEGVA